MVSGLKMYNIIFRFLVWKKDNLFNSREHSENYAYSWLYCALLALETKYPSLKTSH